MMEQAGPVLTEESDLSGEVYFNFFFLDILQYTKHNAVLLLGSSISLK